MVASPYDPEVHDAKRRATTWIGDKVPLTEACDDSGLPLITPVATPPAPVLDRAALDPIHAALETRGLLPGTHLVDADQLVASRRAMNLVRLGAWLAGTPLARTRRSAFTRLMALPAAA